MAVINSLGIGNAAKSAGNITYAHYRGRTIAKQRITQNKSNTRLQQEQRTTFAAVEKICRGFNGILSLFSNTKYGYKLNRFIKLNYDVLAQYVKSTDEWDDRGTPVGDAQAYIETYFAGASKNYIAKKLNIYTSFDLRRNFRISVNNEASGPLTIRFSDAGHVYKSVVARFVSVFPSTLLTPVIDVPLSFGTETNQQVWSGTYTAGSTIEGVWPLYAVSLIIDGKPCSSFWAVQLPYTYEEGTEEALEIQEAPPALSARKRAHK